MHERTYRALVVDDDEIVCEITVHGLEHEGFRCDVAHDGVKALEMVGNGHYDVVITDLQMPNGHGHALAVHLLQQEIRPLIIVLTGLVEPRLVKDLFARGVDDVVWKPVMYEAFAAKITSLLRRRAASAHGSLGAHAAPPSPSDMRSGGAVTKAEMDGKLSLLATILPISQAALDVFKMSGDSSCSAEQLAAAAARDPSLAAELLRLANGAYYNPSGRKILELEEAITRIGQKRVGELALSASTSITLTRTVIPWMDLSQLWRCSVAAGVAVEMLVAEGGHEKIKDGLLLSAIMHGLGRVVLGSLFPEEYKQMVADCRSSGQPLVDRERAIFPENHAQVMARLLTSWNIPPEVSRPLTFILDDYSTLTRLPEPTRTKVELVKLAVLTAKTAVGAWETWDRVELPPSTLLKRLQIKDAASILRQTKKDYESILGFKAASGPARQPHDRTGNRSDSNHEELRYVALTADTFDFLAEIIGGMGVRLAGPAQRMEDLGGNSVFNCLGANSLRVPPPHSGRSVTIVCDPDHADRYREHGSILSIPASYGVLQSACRKMASRETPATVTR